MLYSLYIVSFDFPICRVFYSYCIAMLRSDPTAPSKLCDRLEFVCEDGTCIHSNLVCNRRNDCPDGSDEFECGLSLLVYLH